MSSLDDLQQLAACIRQPDQALLPSGVEGERVAIYQELFFNTLESALSSGFPVLWDLLGERRRQRLAREFLASHRCRTPWFLQIGSEFIGWLAEERQPQDDDPPFLLELAHYERVELELDISEACLPRQGWSPLARPLAYRWPVQLIGSDYQPAEPPAGPTCLLVWRDAVGKVRFMQLAPMAFHLACRLQQGMALADALASLAAEAGVPCDDDWLAMGRQLCEQWQDSGIYAAGD